MILVTGGSGLIGDTICKHLIKEHYLVSNYDLVENKSVNWIDASEPFDIYKHPDYGTFIDCARYEYYEDQMAVWNIIIKQFKRNGGGKIILFSSIYGHVAPDFKIYTGTDIKETPLEYAFWKGGTEQTVRYLAQKLKPWNIQVNAIAPGGVWNHHSDEFMRNYRESGGALMIEPKNILPVVDMLLHPDNAVNGQIITIDGGWSL